MDKFPHQYYVTATAKDSGAVLLKTDGGASLACFPPPQFGGDLGRQSPEHLLTEAVAGCFILTFRSVARSMDLPWVSLDCEALGVLDKGEGGLRFTGFNIKARLEISKGESRDKALKLLNKAEKSCLVSASLNCPVTLNTDVVEVAD